MKHGFVLILLSLVSCKSQQATNNAMSTYVYFDGSANKYTITQSSIKYDPVTPEDSSTGFYSGGEPYQKNIDPLQFESLEAVFKKAIQVKEDQTSNRDKGTGMLFIPTSESPYIFKMHSVQKQEIESAIKKAAGIL